MSVRARFILISLSITILALLLFTSVMHGRVIKYKHAQETHLSRLYLQHLHKKMAGLNRLDQIKAAFKKEEVKELQTIQIYAVLDENNNEKYISKNKDIARSDLTKIITEIKNKKFEGPLEIDHSPFFWIAIGFDKGELQNNNLLMIYSLSSTAYSEFFKFFGFPLIISGFLLCWLMVWASIILSSFIVKLEKQKLKVSSQAADVERARDEAMHANLAKSHFLANMSHEIRTPLTAIIGYAESSLDVDQTLEERSKATKTIIKSGKHLLHIINEILDLSKIEAGKLEIEKLPFSIVHVLEDINQIVSNMAYEKGLNFKINYVFPIPDKIYSDQLRIKQILLNLCSNAIKFTDEGSVLLNVSYSDETSILKFEVVDTGIGLTEEQKDKIFSSFEQADSSITRKFGGTGLGLMLSKQLLEMLNGTLSVKSTVDYGSKFIATIKLEDADQTGYIYEIHPKETAASGNLSNVAAPLLDGKVLVAEDNKDIQGLVNLLLKKTGVEVNIVENGKLAVEIAAAENYDLILMDLQMPVMDGKTAMKQLISQSCSVPVIAMTANAMKSDREECKQLGFAGFISKPIDRNDLHTVLLQYLKPAQRSENNDTLITSNLLENDPELIDLIDKFIGRLPGMQKAINDAYDNNNEEQLSGLIHQMKGVGGNYGYPALTELCAKIEFQITSQNTETISSLMQEFNQMIEEIISGYDQNHEIARKSLSGS